MTSPHVGFPRETPSLRSNPYPRAAPSVDAGHVAGTTRLTAGSALLDALAVMAFVASIPAGVYVAAWAKIMWSGCFLTCDAASADPAAGACVGLVAACILTAGAAGPIGRFRGGARTAVLGFWPMSLVLLVLYITG